jgi:hypothetical protein
LIKVKLPITNTLGSYIFNTPSQKIIS